MSTMGTAAKQGLTYARLLETNNLIQGSADETYWLCVTRTVQESKLFPVPAYMMYSYLNSYFRYPELLRKIEASMPAEELGDRARNMSGKIGALAVGWAMPGFYLLGRQWLLEMGMIRPTDALGDLVYVLDFWKRYQLAYHRDDGHLSNRDFGHRAQVHPERTVQVFQSDLFDCEPGDDLHEAATAFMSTTSQYGFLISCESRISLHNDGPYKMADGRELMIRDFMDLAEGDYPWLDGVAADVPYSSLTVTMALKGTHVYLTDDWGSFESDPEFQAHHVSGVGLYTSDALTDGYQPVGMGSREELIRTFHELTGKMRAAMDGLWRRIAAWSRDEMLDAGAIVYFSIFKDLAHIAGVYDMADWMLIDERAHKFKPLLNDEYSRDALVQLCVGMMNNHRLAEHTLMQHSNDQARLYTLVPYDVLNGTPYVPTSGPIRPGDSVLLRKNDRYRTSKGVLGLDEYNRLARESVPGTHGEGRRFLCETWVKYNAGTAEADGLYTLEQQHSRTLTGRGSSLTGADILDVRAGIRRRRPDTDEVLHALAVVKKGTAAHVAELLGADKTAVAAVIARSVALGHVVEAGNHVLLSPLARLAAAANCGRLYATVRDSKPFHVTMEEFERLNAELKAVMSQWQVRHVAGDHVPNDHTDAAYDEKVIDALGSVHETVEGILDRFADEVPRLAVYRDRLSSALEKAEDGEVAWVSDVTIASYHTVWFELHEDLLRMLGQERHE